MSQLSLFKGKRQRGVKLPLPLERVTHREVAKLLRKWRSPGWLANHFPAGELRDKITAGKLKGMGLVPGWSDFILIGPDGTHYWLELKRGKAPLTEDQEAFRDALQARGVPWAVARSLEEAIDILADWGALRVRVSA